MPHADLRVLPGEGTGTEPTAPVDRLPVALVAVSALVDSLSPRAAGADEAHVKVLTEVEEKLPPILVHRPTMRVLDGLHRLEVARRRERTHIAARLVEGDEADAFVLGVHSNTAHGLPLSLDDRKQAASRIMATHRLWSDRRIAAVTGLAARTVADVRKQRGDVATARVGRDGRVRPIDSAIGRRRAAELILADPGMSLRQIARAAGISPETVRDVRAKLQRGDSPASRSRPASPGTGEIEPLAVADAGPPAVSRLDGVRSLRADPSLRMTETGRMLLRLLDLHAMSSGNWAEIIESVPSHSSELVAEAARACAVMWTDLSRGLAPGVRRLA